MSRAFGGSGRWLVLLFVVLLLATVGMAQARFTFGNQISLANLDFRSGLAGWAVRPADSRVTVKDGVLTLAQPDKSQFIVVSRPVADIQRFSYLRFSGEIKVDGVIEGELFWQQGRIVLVGRDADGRAMIRNSHVLVARKGSGGWTRHQAVFKVLPGMSEMRLSVELPRAAGQVSVRNLNLRAAEQAGWYRAGEMLLIIGWAVAAMWGSRRLLAERGGFGWRQPALALLLALSLVQVIPQLGATRFSPLLPFGFVDISGGVTPEMSEKAARDGLAPTFAERASNGWVDFRSAVMAVLLDLKPLDLLGHFAGFALLAFVCRWLSRARPWTVLPYVMGTALAGEVAQWSVQGLFTGADLVELTADFAGVAVACLSAALWARRSLQAA